MYERRRTIQGTIKRALLVLPAAAFFAAGTLLSPTQSQADSAVCHEWHIAKHTSLLLDKGDQYRICDEHLEILIIEDEHEMMAVHTIN